MTPEGRPPSGQADPSRRAARLLRRRGAGDRDRGPGARLLRGPGLRPPRDRPQPPRRRATSRRAACASSRSSTRCPTAPPRSSPRTASRPRCATRRRARGLRVIDATCPLVTKVHLEAIRFARMGYEILLVGHAGHEEVEGTMGEAASQIRLVSSVADAEPIDVRDPAARRVHHPDDALDGRHAADRRDPAAPLPEDPRPRQGRHLLRDAEPPGRRAGAGAAGARSSSSSARATPPTRTASSRRRSSPARGRTWWTTSRRSIRPGSKASRPSASPPAPRPRSSWSTEIVRRLRRTRTRSRSRRS